MKELNENIDELIESTPILLLQFGQDTCGPCHAIRYKLEKWLESHDNVEARYIDIEKEPALCAQKGIFSAPTVMVYTDGRLAMKESGYFSLEDMLRRVEAYIEMRK